MSIYSYNMKTLLLNLLLLAPVLNAAAPQGGALQPPIAPAENPVTPEKAVLGKMLFFEEQLSSDDTMACATCHAVAGGFTDQRDGQHPGADGVFGTGDDLFTSPGMRFADSNGDFQPEATFGFGLQQTGRRSPDLLAALYAPEAFWDGRATDTFINPETGAVSIITGGALESQAVGPPLSGAEMAHQNRDWPMLTAKLASARPMALATNLTPDIMAALMQDSTYPALFNRAFGTSDVTAERIAFAIATYERTLVPDQTPFDNQMNGLPGGMDMNQMMGMMQFNMVGNCGSCHTMPLFSDNLFHNNGLRPNSEDDGRQTVTGDINDRGKFKTPSLRNLNLRNRFNHTGEQDSLIGSAAHPGVLDIYEAGGGPNTDNRDPLLAPLVGLNKTALQDFLLTALADPRVAAGLPPFDAPTLYSEWHPIGQSADLYGSENASGNGIAPRLIVGVPALIGSSVFSVGLIDAPASASSAYLAVSTQRNPNAWVNNLLMNVRLPLYTLRNQPLTGGHTTFHIAIPNSPSLSGREVVMQGFVLDATANGGRAASTTGASYMVL
jgi:cytochrome c peroxidase